MTEELGDSKTFSANPPADRRNFSDIVADQGHKYAELPNVPVKLDDIFIMTPENHANFPYMMSCYAAENGKTVEEMLFGKPVLRDNYCRR